MFYRKGFAGARYSMGGFGAFQLGGFAPDAFDVVISVAGYGLGTLEPERCPVAARSQDLFKNPQLKIREVDEVGKRKDGKEGREKWERGRKEEGKVGKGKRKELGRN